MWLDINFGNISQMSFRHTCKQLCHWKLLIGKLYSRVLSFENGKPHFSIFIHIFDPEMWGRNKAGGLILIYRLKAQPHTHFHNSCQLKLYWNLRPFLAHRQSIVKNAIFVGRVSSELHKWVMVTWHRKSFHCFLKLDYWAFQQHQDCFNRLNGVVTVHQSDGRVDGRHWYNIEDNPRAVVIKMALAELDWIDV